jgi:hypothetical protein
VRQGDIVLDINHVSTCNMSETQRNLLLSQNNVRMTLLREKRPAGAPPVDSPAVEESQEEKAMRRSSDKREAREVRM